MAIKFTDNAHTKLAADITSTDTIITLQAGTGQLFPAVDGASGDYFVITLEDSSGNREFVRVDYRQGDTLGNATYPCQRGYWGSTAQAFSASNTVVAVRLSSNALDKAIADHTQWATKADKVSPVTAGNLAGLDATGNLTDSGVTFGTAANNVLQLDASGLVPLANIPSVLTGKDADSVDGMHLTDLDARYVNVTGDSINSITVAPNPPVDCITTQVDDAAHWAIFDGAGTNRMFEFYTPSGANAGNMYVRTDVGGSVFEVLRFRPDGGLDFGDPNQPAPGHVFNGSDGGYVEFRYGTAWRGRVRADSSVGLDFDVYSASSAVWNNKVRIELTQVVVDNAFLSVRANATQLEHRDSSGGLRYYQYLDPVTGDWRLYSDFSSSYVGLKSDGTWYSSKPSATGYTRISPNFCRINSLSWVGVDSTTGNKVWPASGTAPAGAKVMLFRFHTRALADGTNTYCDVNIRAYTGSASNRYTTVVDHQRLVAYISGLPSGTIVGFGSELLMIPVQDDGKCYFDVTLDSGTQMSFDYTPIGYWD